MMTEISLNILDIAENSIRAEASLIQIKVAADGEEDTLTVEINDNGKGMNEEQVNQCMDPFFTTRNTRKVGLGISFFKMAAIATGGSFEISSTEGTGTDVKAVFKLSHIDRMPLGDINSTIYTLIAFNTNIDFIFTYSYDERQFILDTREFKEILEGIPLNSSDVLKYLKEYLDENKLEVDRNLLP
ncbi:ATP-binding protein [Clostridium aminobutyricum]|uniref:histidine kinase n=1 Tax=Clostridium aminobutyricum TaxID=33953 RepID=A0A939D759_CLOAM|nr:ATP-binding protein [Clostridium aminobutyricum]MBN7772073.1 ATP-binding protein [Clostridium aminobutyricum]